MAALKDITGQVFGKLTAIKYAGVNTKGRTCWECVCACSRRVKLTSNQLCTGHTRSCGCLIKELADEKTRQPLTDFDPASYVIQVKDKPGNWKGCTSKTAKGKRRYFRYHNDPVYRRKVIDTAVRTNRRNKMRYLLCCTKHRAEKKNLAFNLTIEDLIVPAICPVLKIPLFNGNALQRDNSPSIDRIVPELGYVKGNIVIISWRANRIKCDATPEELKMISEYVSKFAEAK